jgi:hypothetical protein
MRLAFIPPLNGRGAYPESELRDDKIVMPGLDPGIHAVPEAQNSVEGTSGIAWMTGSSPVMTS